MLAFVTFNHFVVDEIDYTELFIQGVALAWHEHAHVVSKDHFCALKICICEVSPREGLNKVVCVPDVDSISVKTDQNSFTR